MNYPNDKKEASADESAKEIEFAENFTNAAREMYSTGNANPGRVGCFTNENIRQMAHSAKLPDDAVMNHLFDCSECFRAYRQAVQSAKNPAAAVAKSGWRNLFDLSSARIGFAGAGLALIVGLMMFSLWVFQAKSPNELTKNIEVSNDSANFPKPGIPPNVGNAISNGAVVNDPVEPSDLSEQPVNRTSRNQSDKPEINRKDDSSPPKIRQSGENAKPEMSGANSVNLELSAGNILRNAVNSAADTSENNRILLPARKVNLNIKLPNSYGNGRYRLRIVDAFGDILLEQKPALKNRVLFLTNLNLQGLETRASKLCLQKNDETPDCFDIKIAM